MTQIVLTKDIYKLGNVGELVTVKAGFARNYLIPKGLALRATKSNLEFFELKKAELKEKAKQDKDQAVAVGKKIDGKIYNYISSASERGMLYGAITPTVVAELLEKNGVKLSKSTIQIPKPIKTLGIHDIRIVLHTDVSSVIRLNVATTEDNADKQLKDESKQNQAAQDDLDALNLGKSQTSAA